MSISKDKGLKMTTSMSEKYDEIQIVLKTSAKIRTLRIKHTAGTNGGLS